MVDEKFVIEDSGGESQVLGDMSGVNVEGLINQVDTPTPPPAPAPIPLRVRPQGETSEVITLPSGATWELITRPKFGRVQQYLKGINENEEDTGKQMGAIVLAFTKAWSFQDEAGNPLALTEANIAEIDSLDVMMVLTRASEVLEPFLEALSNQRQVPSTKS